MKIRIYFIVLLFLFFRVNVVLGDTTFVHVIDFQNSRFSSDIELAIEYKDRKLNLFSRSRTVGEIFKELEKKGKIEIKVDEETAQKKVSIFVSGKTLKEGIEAVLNTIGQRDLAILYKTVGAGLVPAQHEVSKVEIRKRTKAEMERIEEAEQRKADEEARQRDREYHELFARMAKEKNKVAKALKDFTDPKTTQKEKTKIMTYFRQESFETPEDKALLKKVYLDPKYKELQGAVEMGLAHVIMDHPEEKDKEYLLQLLKQRKMGMVIYSLKFIWDERFIPELIKIVKDKNEFPIGRSQAAEILGVRQVKEAVPALEGALLQMWGKENITQVHDALTIITGMTYKVINGKAIAFPYQKPVLGEGIFIPGK